jgi:hypothetical protein
MTARAEKAAVKTVMRGCRIERMAAMRKVLSPISLETLHWMKLHQHAARKNRVGAERKPHITTDGMGR